MPRFGVRFAALLAATPFLAAIVVHTLPTAVIPIAAAPPRPSLAFDQYTVDLGPVAPRPVIQARFDFTNNGPGPVSITKLEPSCGCLRPQLRGGHTTFKPGERGRFYVAMQTANEEPGPHAYTVTVKYNDPEPREEVVQFRLDLPELKVSVEPSEVYFYQLSGTDDERMIYVSDRRGQPLDVLAAECTLDRVQVEVLPPETAPEGHTRTPVKVSVPGDYAAGRHTGYIIISTSSSEFGKLHAAILVEGVGVRQVGAESNVKEPERR